MVFFPLLEICRQNSCQTLYFQETWYRALHHCSMHGMRLASILSRDENEQLLKQIRDSRKCFFEASQTARDR